MSSIEESEEQKAAKAKADALGAWKTFLESTPPNTPRVIADLAEYVGISASLRHWKVGRPRLQLARIVPDIQLTGL